jgi:hypothetical protein
MPHRFAFGCYPEIVTSPGQEKKLLKLLANTTMASAMRSSATLVCRITGPTGGALWENYLISERWKALTYQETDAERYLANHPAAGNRLSGRTGAGSFCVRIQVVGPKQG